MRILLTAVLAAAIATPALAQPNKPPPAPAPDTAKPPPDTSPAVTTAAEAGEGSDVDALRQEYLKLRDELFAAGAKDLLVTAKASDGGDIPYAWKKSEAGSYDLRLAIDVKTVARAGGGGANK